MKTSSIFRIGLFGSLAFSLAACGGVGGGDDYSSVSPIRRVTVSDLENRTGITNRTPKAVPNAVAIINNIDGQANARLVIRDSQLLDDDSTRDAAIYMQIDQNRDGIFDGPEDYESEKLNLNPNGDPISPITNKPIVTTNSMSYGGADMLMAQHALDYNNRTTVYVPASTASDMYGGMYVQSSTPGQSSPEGSGAIATWGKKISADEFADVRNTELQAQDGQATYHGVAEAIVNGAGGYESGEYRDRNATGKIDFSQNKITTAANLTGVDNESSRIGVATSMTYNGDGTVNQGAALVTGLDAGSVAGVATGEIYGPNADTLGVTLSGTNTNTGTTVIGGMLLNRTDD